MTTLETGRKTHGLGWYKDWEKEENKSDGRCSCICRRTGLGDCYCVTARWNICHFRVATCRFRKRECHLRI